MVNHILRYHNTYFVLISILCFGFVRWVLGENMRLTCSYRKLLCMRANSLRLDVRFLARLFGQDIPNLTDKKMNGNFTSIGGKAGVM